MTTCDICGNTGTDYLGRPCRRAPHPPDSRQYRPQPTSDAYRDPITLMACPDCGCAVLDTELHDRHHDQETTTP